MTADQALERAKAVLDIQDVWLHQSSAWMAKDFDPKFSEIEHIGVQYKHVVARATFAEVTDGEQQAPYLYRVYIDLGMRIVSKEANPPNALASVEATLVAEYQTSEDPGEDALNAFAARNASHHVWPFWREYVVSQCDRMRLPRVMVPTMHLKHTAPSGTDETS